jgi:MoxR-like ATPase
MQERRVTIDGENHQLSPNFTVFATQNPIEYEGTYPLPEAQKDRFMFKISMDYPQRDEELTLARGTLGKDSPESLVERGAVRPVLSEKELTAFREALQQVTVKEELTGYVVDIVRGTRQHESLLVGAGPRATQALLLSARAHAVMDGRDFVTPDDVKAMAPAVLEHRLVMRPEFEIEELTVREVLQRILEGLAVPR